MRPWARSGPARVSGIETAWTARSARTACNSAARPRTWDSSLSSRRRREAPSRSCSSARRSLPVPCAEAAGRLRRSEVVDPADAGAHRAGARRFRYIRGLSPYSRAAGTCDRLPYELWLAYSFVLRIENGSSQERVQICREPDPTVFTGQIFRETAGHRAAPHPGLFFRRMRALPGTTADVYKLCTTNSARNPEKSFRPILPSTLFYGSLASTSTSRDHSGPFHRCICRPIQRIVTVIRTDPQRISKPSCG